MVAEGVIRTSTPTTALKNFRKAIDKGVLKVMTKMGISTLQSYRGAQIFEAIGLNTEVVDRYFTWTASRIEGIGLDVIAREAQLRHDHAYQRLARARRRPRRRRPVPVAPARRAPHVQPEHDREAPARGARGQTTRCSRSTRPPPTTRAGGCAPSAGCSASSRARPIPLDEVEPASEIVKRFKTGAMSLGSISREAHENLAIAMNRLGGKSNTGEGGEDPVRYRPDPNGDSRRSAIKQVASGRFGVTSYYLVNADELQIKMAQGAKPGEGGQLPGHKVDEYIAKIRYSTPGVGLISPPPHHDIYSIEDLAQLIHDLKNVERPRAHQREARGRGRRRHGRRGRVEGEGRRRAHQRRRRRHRRLAADVDQARRHPVGARPRRDAADARRQRPARPHPRRDRRPAEDRPRRRRRGAARRRGVRLRVVRARRVGLHHDARLPPEHLPGRHRHAGPAAARRSSRASPSTSSTS